MGADRLQITRKVLLPEARAGVRSRQSRSWSWHRSATRPWPASSAAAAWATSPIRYGYQRFQTDVMFVTVILLVVLVQAIQWMRRPVRPFAARADSSDPCAGHLAVRWLAIGPRSLGLVGLSAHWPVRQ